MAHPLPREEPSWGGAFMAPYWIMRDSHRINLRLPLEEFQEIDHLREQEPVKVSRNIWIAMAIREKLERDSKRLEGSHA